MEAIALLAFTLTATGGIGLTANHVYTNRLIKKTKAEILSNAYRTAAIQKQRQTAVALAAAVEAETDRAQDHAIQRRAVAAQPPEVARLRRLVTEFANDVNAWDKLIAIGDIYHRGAFPRFLPNDNIALQLFHIAAACPDGHIAGVGQGKYIEARTDPINAKDRAGQPFPSEPGMEAIRIAQLRIQGTPSGLFQKPRMPKLPDTVTAVRPTADGRYHVTTQRRWGARRTVQRPTVELPQVNENWQVIPPAPNEELEVIPEYRIDGQNVHDHAVSKITKHNVDRLRENDSNKGTITDRELLDMIRESIILQPELTKDQRGDALTTLEALTGDIHGSLGTSETEALRLVWNRINSEKDETLKTNLTETLAKQLASGVEHGHVVCSHGKITRITSTLETLDDQTVAKPTWALRDEMNTLASKIRDDVLTPLSDKDKEAYNNGLKPEVEKYMKEELDKRAKQIYCENLKMNENIIAPIIEQVSEGF